VRGKELLAVLFPKAMRAARPALVPGIWLGLWLTAGYFAQVMGLMTITASRSAFITSTYILFTPFLAIPLARAYPGIGEILGVALGFTGILLFSADVGFSLRAGDLWTLGCALAFGIQIVVTNIVAKKHEPELGKVGDDAKRHRRLCELNAREQVANIAQCTAVQEAWERGQPLEVHGWIYDLKDGLLTDLQVSRSS